jgi:methionyl-tRNA formyltransferase
MRIVFFGTPDFAVPTLEAVAREHEVVLVVAQPDKPAGRGMKMQAPPVAARARELALPLVQPSKIRDEGFLQQIAQLAPDAGVVIAYGKILPARLLEIPKHGFFNVHASVLPKYRGAAPIQRAIAAGETTTGVTIMNIDEQLDHGPMLAIETIDIGPDERLPSVSRRLAELGGPALVRVLRDVENGTAVRREQEHGLATLAPKIDKREGLVTFQETTAEIYNRFRGFDPWPGVFVEAGGETVKILDMQRSAGDGAPRTILSIGEGVVVATADGAVRLVTLQRPGKPRAAAADVARGLQWKVGERLP